MDITDSSKVEENISSFLWVVYKKTKEMLEEYRRNNSISIIEKLFVKREIEEMVYDEGISEFQTSSKLITKKEWYISDQNKFVESVKNSIPNFNKWCNKICDCYETSSKQAEDLLSKYILELSTALLENPSDEAGIRYVTDFLNALAKGDVNIVAKIWLGGVWLEINETKLDEKTLIRKPIKSDLETESPLERSLYDTRPFGDTGISCILIFQSRGKYNKDIHPLFNSRIDFFRLFKLGSIVKKNMLITNDSLINKNYVTSLGDKNGSHYKYGLCEKDIGDLKMLYDRILPILTLLMDKKEERVYHLSNAFQQYKEATIIASPFEKSIAFAVSCLEALCLKSEERSELSLRLAQRATILLKNYGFKPIEVFNNLTLAYEIRSLFVHGSIIKREEYPKIHELAKDILNYTRIVILIFIQLYDKIEKDAFINKINNALLDENANEKLAFLLKEVFVTL